MRFSATVISMSWIPSESISGAVRATFDLGIVKYDRPPPARVSGLVEVRRLRDENRIRFANVLSAWVDVDDGEIRAAGWSPESGVVMGDTGVALPLLDATLQGFPLQTLQAPPHVTSDRVRFVQTAGGRSGVPYPRAVPHAPFVQWQAPIVWTTLSLTIDADGGSEVSLVGASAFPRHWVYGAGGALDQKSGLADAKSWSSNDFGQRTPWGAHDSTIITTKAESELERHISHVLMSSSHRPVIRRLPAGAVITRQGDRADEVFLVLDGLVGVEVDQERIAEVGPGAVLGESAATAGSRNATLVALTGVRLAVAGPLTVDEKILRTLAETRRPDDLHGEQSPMEGI